MKVSEIITVTESFEDRGSLRKNEMHKKNKYNLAAKDKQHNSQQRTHALAGLL
jgi:hypothetical protein